MPEALRAGVAGVGALGRHHARVWAATPGRVARGRLRHGPGPRRGGGGRVRLPGLRQPGGARRRRAGAFGRRSDRGAPRRGATGDPGGLRRAAREADDHDARRGRRPHHARGRPLGDPAGGAHRALQPRDRPPARRGQGRAFRRGAPARLVLAAQPRRRRGARPDGPRPRHRDGPRRLRAGPDRGGGGAGPHAASGHRERPAALRVRPDREPHREPRLASRRCASSACSLPAPTCRPTLPLGKPRSTNWRASQGPPPSKPAAREPRTRSRFACRSSPSSRLSAAARAPVVSGADGRRALALALAILERMAGH